MTTLYDVILEGKAAPGKDPASVMTAMKELLKLDDEGVDLIFSGRSITLKKGVNAETAEKYRKAIEAAGAVCKVGPMSGED